MISVLALTMDIHIPQSQSLKEKRGVIRPVIDGVRNRFSISIAETDHQDTWQRSEIGVVVVSGSVTVAEELMDEVERFIWSFPELTVLDTRRQWMEMD